MSTSNGEMVFDDLEPKVTKVRLKYADRTETYTLHQATEDASVKTENHRHRLAKLTEDGKMVSVEGLADGPSFLVSQCLRHEAASGEAFGALVPLDKVRTFRPDVVRKLHDWILENSGMAATDTVETLEKRIERDTRMLAKLSGLTNGSTAKNSQGATAATSA